MNLKNNDLFRCDRRECKTHRMYPGDPSYSILAGRFSFCCPCVNELKVWKGSLHPEIMYGEMIRGIESFALTKPGTFNNAKPFQCFRDYWFDRIMGIEAPAGDV